MMETKVSLYQSTGADPVRVSKTGFWTLKNLNREGN